MSDERTDPVSETVGRIGVPDPVEDPNGDDPASAVTGELGDLLAWWRGCGGGTDVATTLLVSPSQVVSPSQGMPMGATETLAQGIADADRAVDSGATLLIPRVAERRDAVARALIGLLTKREASAVLGQPAGVTDQAWMDSCAAIRDLMAEQRDHGGDYVALLAGFDAQHIAWVSGTLLGAAARRTPCLIDGTDEWAAALIADRLSHRARRWWRGSSTSSDPARTAACERIDIDPGLPLDLADDAGLGQAATIALLQITLDHTPDPAG